MMNLLQKIGPLALLVLRLGLVAGDCDYIFYTRNNALCYGMTADKSMDICLDIPNIGYVEAMAIHPLTDEFYIVSIPSGATPRSDDPNTENDRFLMKFDATVEINGTLSNISEPEQIGATLLATDYPKKISALAFTCQGVPRLFGLSDYRFKLNQTLQEIDPNTGDFTELLTLVTTSESFAGNGLFYNIETDRLYRIGDSSGPTMRTGQTIINPNNLTIQANVLRYTWAGSNFGALIFASYIDEANFVAGSGINSEIYLASLSDNTQEDESFFDNRDIDVGGEDISSVQCQDYGFRCENFLTNAPSEQPSAIPSNIPSTIPSGIPSINPSIIPSNNPTIIPSINPSNMPSSDPSGVPTEMPVESFTTTDDNIITSQETPQETPEADGVEIKEINLFIIASIIILINVLY